MYWVIAFLLWAAGFLTGLFNIYNNIVAAASPMNARLGWLPGRYGMSIFYRFLPLLLYASSAILLYVTKSIIFHWAIALAVTIALAFFSSFFASTIAWMYFAKMYPNSYADYQAKKNMGNILK